MSPGSVTLYIPYMPESNWADLPKPVSQVAVSIPTNGPDAPSAFFSIDLVANRSKGEENFQN